MIEMRSQNIEAKDLDTFVGGKIAITNQCLFTRGVFHSWESEISLVNGAEVPSAEKKGSPSSAKAYKLTQSQINPQVD